MNPPHGLNIPKYSDIGSSIIRLYCNELTRQISALGPVEKNDLNSKWSIDIDTYNMFISKRARKKPFGIFLKFMDPSNNLTIMKYVPGTDPLSGFDFHAEIPNPYTRQVALTNADYTKRYTNREK